jgi:hypothetical protein
MPHPAYVHSGGQTLVLRNISVDFDANIVHLGSMNGSVDVAH